MRRTLPRKLVMLIIFGSMAVLFTATMLLITFLPEKVDFEAVADTVTTAEDTATNVTVLANDLGADPADITISTFTQPEHGYVIKYAQGLRYTPYTNFFGTDSFSYTIQNPAGDTSTTTVTVTVTATNDDPRAYNDYVACDQNGSIVIDVAANDTDQDGDDLVVAGFTHPDHGTVRIDEDNHIVYTPDPDFVGSDSFTYDIEDPVGANDRGRVTVSVEAVE
ncbi:MAG: Ig-like domain-containing protein [Candidatus Izemoplasmatales bacterium]